MSDIFASLDDKSKKKLLKKAEKLQPFDTFKLNAQLELIRDDPNKRFRA